MKTEVKSVDAPTANRLVESGARVIDVRSPEQWAAGHIEGSDWVAAGRVSSHSVGRADSVLMICSNGSRSRRAARKLAKEGYRVYHLAGGIAAWHDAGYALTSSNGSRARVL